MEKLSQIFKSRNERKIISAARKSIIPALIVAIITGLLVFIYIQKMKMPEYYKGGRFRGSTIVISFKLESSEQNNLNPKMTLLDWGKNYKSDFCLDQLKERLMSDDKLFHSENEWDDFIKNLSSSVLFKENKVYLHLKNCEDKELGKSQLNELMKAYQEIFNQNFPAAYFHIQIDPTVIDEYWVYRVSYPSPKRKAILSSVCTGLCFFILFFILFYKLSKKTK